MYWKVKSLRVLPSLVAISLALAAVVSPGKAEDITLHDGTKLTGAIVGFDDGMFKVETEFGFALIRKDKVKSIAFGPGNSPRTKDAAPVAAPAPSPQTLEPSTPQTAPKPVVTNPPVAAEAKPALPPPPPPPPPVSRPIDQPLPKEIRERLEGTTYINETFQFSFYKPPGWRIHENTARETGRAIVAIGPEDEHTILFVDRQVWSGEPNLKSDATETNLRETYQNYRKTSETAARVDGRPAVRKEFEGELDGALWRGVAVRVAQDKIVFGVIGLTSAETLQFHEAVLNKIINSFRFRAGTPTASN